MAGEIGCNAWEPSMTTPRKTWQVQNLSRGTDYIEWNTVSEHSSMQEAWDTMQAIFAGMVEEYNYIYQRQLKVYDQQLLELEQKNRVLVANGLPADPPPRKPYKYINYDHLNEFRIWND